MRRGFKCKREIISSLQQEYDNILKKEYNNEHIKIVYDFESIAENRLRNILNDFYDNPRSRDQAWRSCKGSLYEYAIFRYIESIIKGNRKLNENFILSYGDEALSKYGDQVVIKNWSDIFPDADILLIDKNKNIVKAIISCKTSLRERLTETAFWKRELERTKRTNKVKVIFITPDKDNELRVDTNRYILMHVIDYTFITDPEKYHKLMATYKSKYGERNNFNALSSKIRLISDFENILFEIY